jgi:hypothetical protein
MRWVLLAALACASLARAEDASLRVVEACRARLDAQTDIGIERVERRCPELRAALKNAPWRELLPATLGERREQISAASLAALAELVRRSGDATRRRPAPDRQTLNGVLAELGEQGQQGATRWERIKRWLQQKFEDRKDDEGTGWLERWSRQFHTSEGVAQAITYLGYALVMALVAYVIFAELRAAGLVGGAERARRRSGPAAEWRRRLMLTDVFEAPLTERPGMMLKLLGEALSRSRRLPAPEGLTARAITRRARLDDESDRAALARVATAAEQAKYSPHEPDSAELEHAVTDARELLGKLARLPAERG